MEEPIILPSLATDIPSKILIAICTLNAPPLTWDRRFQVSDSADEDRVTTENVVQNCILATFNASQVCKTWRMILLSAPELWCRMIDPYDPYIAEIMLKRSQTLPISLWLPEEKYRSGRDEEDFETEMGRQYADRLREYHFKGQFFLGLDTQSYYLRGSMNARYFPLLEDLSISFPAYSELPHKFPGAGTPNLKRLHLERCFFPPSSQLSALDRTLVRLHIDDGLLTEDGLIDALRALPHLQALILNRAFTQVSQGSVELRPDNLVCLSHLQELRIIDSHSSRAASFLGRITTTQELSIFCLELELPRSNWNDSAQSLIDARLFHQLGWILSLMNASKPLLYLRITPNTGVAFCDDPTDMILGHVELAGKTHLLPTPEHYFHIHFIPSSPSTSEDRPPSPLEHSKNNFVGEFFAAIGNLSAYSQVRYLTLPDYEEGVNKTAITQVLRQCGEVRALEDVSWDLWGLLRGMDDHFEVSDNRVLPSLEELSFSALDPFKQCNVPREMEAGASVEDINGTMWLARPISPQELSSYVEEEDPDYQDESEGSVSEDGGDFYEEIDPFINDLVDFCENHPSIRVVSFSDAADEVIEEIKQDLGSLGVDVCVETDE
ncbi:hypothetical protein NP233_g8042 [Leucocoprinus birnbaumii]|uniref:F-box domain-containing protein n=1 Tax=Leucocoprinus birnbaumii TaxID=56174 RepID=A0AAD5VTJ7_9AGAR|nr:hypothetical protein NP233_g8042 [Leucocoprinus birnbaumii]